MKVVPSPYGKEVCAGANLTPSEQWEVIKHQFKDVRVSWPRLAGTGVAGLAVATAVNSAVAEVQAQTRSVWEIVDPYENGTLFGVLETDNDGDGKLDAAGVKPLTKNANRGDMVHALQAAGNELIKPEGDCAGDFVVANGRDGENFPVGQTIYVSTEKGAACEIDFKPPQTGKEKSRPQILVNAVEAAKRLQKDWEAVRNGVCGIGLAVVGGFAFAGRKALKENKERQFERKTARAAHNKEVEKAIVDMNKYLGEAAENVNDKDLMRLAEALISRDKKNVLAAQAELEDIRNSNASVNPVIIGGE